MATHTQRLTGRLVGDLAAWQTDHRMSDSDVATILGVRRATWAGYRLGLKPPGQALARRIRNVRGFARRADSVLLGTRYPE